MYELTVPNSIGMAVNVGFYGVWTKFLVYGTYIWITIDNYLILKMNYNASPQA